MNLTLVTNKSFKTVDMLLKECHYCLTEFGLRSQQYADARTALEDRAEREKEIWALRVRSIRQVA